MMWLEFVKGYDIVIVAIVLICIVQECRDRRRP
jgi:hypothetical protein